MLTLFLKETATHELTYAKFVNVETSGEVSLTNSISEEALTNFFLSYEPGEIVPLSDVPYVMKTWLKVVDVNGNSTLFDTDIKTVTNLSNVIMDLEGVTNNLYNSAPLIHSKYKFNESGNSGHGVLALNVLYVAPTIIIPNLGQ